jgi:EmrB/QacA subfamily drug resistance transporter
MHYEQICINCIFAHYVLHLRLSETLKERYMEEIKIKNKNLALVLLAGAQFLVVLDATIVNIALPAISKSLHFSSAANLQWIISAYTLTFGGLLLLGGRLADLYGRKRIFLLGISLFSLSSLASGLSQNSGEIIVFRAIQGVGAALLSPAALSLVLNIFKEGKERNRALGVWSGVAAGGGAAGLLLGGILTQYVNWRWVFLVNVPVGIIVIFFSRIYLPTIVENVKDKSLDVPGAVLVTAGLMTLVFAFIKTTTYGWTSGKTLGLLAGAVVLLAAFVFNESVVRKPLVDLSIFKKRNITFSNLVQLPIIAALYGMFFYLSIYLQEVLHYSPVKSGLANLPFTVFLAITAGIVSGLVAKVRPKIILSIAPFIMAAGLFFLSMIPVHGHYLTNIFPGIALLAIGIGATFVAITLTATSGVSHKQAGLASGLLNTSQQIGGALGLAILTVFSTSRTKAVLASSHSHTASAAAYASVQGFRRAFLIACGLAIAAGILAIVGLPNEKINPNANEEAMLETEIEDIPIVPGI